MIFADIELLRGSTLFDAEWYLAEHPGIPALGIAAQEHYLRVGASLGYDPGPKFSTIGYLADAPDVAAAGVNPLVHYLRIGRSEGRSVRPAGSRPEPPPVPVIDPIPQWRGPVAHPGNRHRRPDRRLVLVVGHLAGSDLFGAERSMLDVLDELASVGLDAVVAVPSDENRAYVDALIARSFEVHVMPVPARRPRQPPDPEIVKLFADLIGHAGIDAVHVNTIVPREPMLAARLMGVPAVVHAREIPTDDPDLERWLDAPAAEIITSVLDDADYVIATSRAVADTFALAGRTAVVPNVVDDALFELAKHDHELVRVALIGSVQPKKGVAEFVALAQLLSSHPAARFRVIGPITPFVHQMTRMGLPPNIEFVGPASDPLAAMEAADIVVNMSTVAEGFGRTTLEAMAAGRPVVVYDRGALPELVRDGVSGFVVPSDDVTLFAHRVGQLIDDPGLRFDMGAAGRALAGEKFAKDRAAAKLAAAYRAILPGPEVIRERAVGVRVPIPTDNRSQFDHQFFVANRARFATATSVAFVDRNRLVSASLLGQRMHLIEFDPVTEVGEIVHSVPTTDGVDEVSVDLIDHDGQGRLIAANCEHASISWYRVGDRSIDFVEAVRLDADGHGFCHGVSFVPDRPELAAIATITGPRDVAIVSSGDQRRRAVFSEDGWIAKSVAFDDSGRMVVCLMNEPIGREASSDHAAKLVLLRLAPDLSELRVLDEAVFPDLTFDGCFMCGDLVMVACQSEDAVIALDVTGDGLVRLPDLLGFSFPHDVDVSPDREWMAVANYGTSDVRLRRLPLHLRALAAARLS